MRISEAVSQSGVPATTLRYYESIGLITTNRLSNGYRIYGEEVLERLSLIEAAKSLEMSLPQISTLFSVMDADTCTNVRETLHPQLANRLEEIDAHLNRIQLLRDRLLQAQRNVLDCPDGDYSCRSECLLVAAGSEEGKGQTCQK